MSLSKILNSLEKSWERDHILLNLKKGFGTDEIVNEERVKKIVVEHLGVEEAKIQSDSKFIDDLGADSLDTVELVMAFEEEFGCEIPDDAAEKIVTLKDAVTYLTANSN